MMRMVLSAWDRGSLYLPILLMGLLALGTYWLVQETPGPIAAVVAKPPRHTPDYFMKNFSVRTFLDSGKLKSEVFGASARHFPVNDVLEIDAIRIRAFDEQGRVTTATAIRALTDGEGSEVQLFGNAVVVREAMIDASGKLLPRMEFRGEYLHAFLDNERITSDRPVEIRRGSDVFVADSLDFDNVHQVMLMRGRVRGTMVPQAAK
ncbi:MAG: LPS export ABC transporter periplasmic protein LptC [Rhodoferax sp.]|nr:LPS export ABC transporter periplasmic protein LptC [Rhodoferax sp.]